MPKIIFFNGPPSSGKDTFAKLVSNELKRMGYLSWIIEFKTKLVDIVTLLYSISYVQWYEWYTEEGKNIPRVELDGMSPRETLIYVAETIIKPNLGYDYFGKDAIKRINTKLSSFDVISISDGGFNEELNTFIKEYGADNVALVRLFRDGYDFSFDSRQYLNNDSVLNIDITTGRDYNMVLTEIMAKLVGFGLTPQNKK